MAEVKVTLRNLRVAPRKARLVAESIKGMHVQSALAQLDLMRERSADPVLKLLKSAIASAKEQKLNEEKLVVKSVRVDKGITLKRAMARAKGRATPVEKKMSHIILELEESERVALPNFVFQEKVKEEKKKEAPKREKDNKPKFKEAEGQKAKERRGFKDKFFRRKSI